MADVRSLLRQERASRQQATRPARQSAAPGGVTASRKRKAAEISLEERKKLKTNGPQEAPTGVSAEEDETVQETVPAAAQADADGDAHMQIQSPAPQPPAPEPPQAAPVADEDDDELDAFMKEMEDAPQQQGGAFAGAVIEAAPMTAAEVAAQAREEQNAQRGRKEEEIEAEKEEAAQHLQEEFDEMEELEERVRKLREQREALRKVQVQANTTDIELPDPEPAKDVDDESESDDEDWDDWRFRPA